MFGLYVIQCSPLILNISSFYINTLVHKYFVLFKFLFLLSLSYAARCYLKRTPGPGNPSKQATLVLCFFPHLNFICLTFKMQSVVWTVWEGQGFFVFVCKFTKCCHWPQGDLRRTQWSEFMLMNSVSYWDSFFYLSCWFLLNNILDKLAKGR